MHAMTDRHTDRQGGNAMHEPCMQTDRQTNPIYTETSIITADSVEPRAIPRCLPRAAVSLCSKEQLRSVQQQADLGRSAD